MRDESVLGVRPGTGANCSSVGSVVDVLYASSAVGAALIAAIVAGLKAECDAQIAPATVPEPLPDNGADDERRD